MCKKTYMDELLDGEAFLEEIDDYIDEWHDSDTDQEIYEYLGMTEEEYGLWVEDDSVLKSIVFARKNNKPIKDVLELNNSVNMVARSATLDQGKEILDWMKETGRISEEDDDE